MNTRINPFVICAYVCLLTVVSLNTADAQRSASPKASRTVRHHHRAVRPNRRNDVQERSQAIKKLNDYNYVKYFGPISGRMYRSTKW